MTDDDRRTAEMSEDGVQPPTLQAADAAPGPVTKAVREALAEEPNAVVSPEVTDPRSDDAEHIVARFSGQFQELPVMDGGEVGWLPPYRAREQFTAALRDALSGTEFGFDAENESRLVFYREH